MSDENESDEMNEEEMKAARLIRAARPGDLPATSVEHIEQRAMRRLIQNTRRSRLTSRAIVRWAFALALVAALVAGSWGLVAAAATSLPGDLLYPVKRLAETAMLAFTPVPQRPVLHLAFAERRLAEVEALAAQGKVLPELILEMTDETVLALIGARAAPAGEQAGLVARLADLSRRQQAVLSEVAAIAPEAIGPALLQAQQAAQQVVDWVTQTAGNTATPSTTLTPSSSFMTRTTTRTPTGTGVQLKTPTPTGVQLNTPTPTGTLPTSTTSSPTPTGQFNTPTSTTRSPTPIRTQPALTTPPPTPTGSQPTSPTPPSTGTGVQSTPTTTTPSTTSTAPQPTPSAQPAPTTPPPPPSPSPPPPPTTPPPPPPVTDPPPVPTLEITSSV